MVEKLDFQKSLDQYILEYMRKKNMPVTAEIFALEARLTPDPPALADPDPRGFLAEWWSFFWPIYSSQLANNPDETASTVAPRTELSELPNLRQTEISSTMAIAPNMMQTPGYSVPTMMPGRELNPIIVDDDSLPTPDLNPNTFRVNPVNYTRTHFGLPAFTSLSSNDSRLPQVDQLPSMLTTSLNNLSIPVASEPIPHERGFDHLELPELPQTALADPVPEGFPSEWWSNFWPIYLSQLANNPNQTASNVVTPQTEISSTTERAPNMMPPPGYSVPTMMKPTPEMNPISFREHPNLLLNETSSTMAIAQNMMPTPGYSVPTMMMPTPGYSVPTMMMPRPEQNPINASNVTPQTELMLPDPRQTEISSTMGTAPEVHPDAVDVAQLFMNSDLPAVDDL